MKQPDYVTAMVRRSPPAGVPVVEGSTPVVAFGDPSRAEVATLGINPSAGEFVERGRLLSGEKRRLATLESLGATRLDALTAGQVSQVVADCATYFDRQPYRRWFDPLDALLHEAVGASYGDGSACHLDLAQWATDPVWSKLDATTRRVLLDDGVPHLREQLARENVRLVIVNGRAVINQVIATGLTTFEVAARLPLGGRTYSLLVGSGKGVRWVAWSVNLQSSFGVSVSFRRQLAKWLGEVSSTRYGPPPVKTRGEPDLPVAGPDGHLLPGLRVAGKGELLRVLRRWLATSEAATLGDVGTFGGRPYLYITLGEREIVLNADTKRSAVDTFVRTATRDPDRPWRVVANRRGRINKVTPGCEVLPGWYAYLSEPVEDEQSI